MSRRLEDLSSDHDERRHLGENDSLVLEVDDLEDEWSQAGFPRRPRRGGGLTTTTIAMKRLCGVIVVTMALLLGVRQVKMWFDNGASAVDSSSSNDIPSSSEPKNKQSTQDTTTTTTTSPTTVPRPPLPAVTKVPTKSPVTAPTPSNADNTFDTETTNIGPFSQLDPVKDLGLWTVDRPADSRPPSIVQPLQDRYSALPTNAWYQNLLLVRNTETPASINRAYVIPYVVDAASPVIPGLRVIPNRLQVGDSTTEVIAPENFGVTLGVAAASSSNADDEVPLDRDYVVQDATQLAVTLEWVSEPLGCNYCCDMYVCCTNYTLIFYKVTGF